MTLGEGFAQVRVRTEIQRRLSLLVLDVQICAVGGEEAGDARARFLVGARGAESHQQLKQTHVSLTDPTAPPTHPQVPDVSFCQTLQTVDKTGQTDGSLKA